MAVGVRRVHRSADAVRVAVIAFLGAQRDSGRRGAVAGVGGRGLGSLESGAGGWSVAAAVFRLDGRHAATVIGRGRAGPVNYRLLQTNQGLSCHVARGVEALVQRGLSREDVWPVGRIIRRGVILLPCLQQLS